ncbi:MAG: hypothetical protein KF817_06090 [Phycisphaeraceae bacterium]|nr:hypothetical protein [Phycisphaeraceae bacterium]
MPRITVLTGICLVVLGLIAYLFLQSDQRSVTALIPAFFGIPFVVLGGVAGRHAGFRRHAMHIAMLIAVLGILGTVRGVTGTIDLVRGAEVARPTAVVVQTIMFAICAIYLGAGVRSFAQARMTKKA